MLKAVGFCVPQSAYNRKSERKTFELYNMLDGHGEYTPYWFDKYFTLDT